MSNETNRTSGILPGASLGECVGMPAESIDRIPAGSQNRRRLNSLGLLPNFELRPVARFPYEAL